MCAFIFDPLFGYFYKRIILGKAAADVTLAWNMDGWRRLTQMSNPVNENSQFRARF